MNGALDRLTDEFSPGFDRNTVQDVVACAYDQLAAARPRRHSSLCSRNDSPVSGCRQCFVPGTVVDETPAVLFLCVHNAGRSQMALGWFNHLARVEPSRGRVAPSPATRSIRRPSPR